ncbi:ligand-binding protein SH3 [Caloranaerobacter sp. TR13]|nr:ligand-binding protein SH3 [Caloranaerobacter sp. TR13]
MYMLVQTLKVLKDELIVMLVAAAPIFELRGAIPLGIAMGFTPLHSTVLSIIGNLIPVPFLLKLLNPLFDYFGRTKMFGKIVNWIKQRTLKRSKKVEKYSVLGLFLLVAIPLPSTGAWTGCVAATLFNIDFKYSFPAIVAGVFTAGLIVFILSSQVISFL